MTFIHGRHNSASAARARIAAFSVMILAAAPALLADPWDDVKRVSLEAKIAALQPLACAAPTTPPDPQVKALLDVLGVYAQQYGAILDGQIKDLAAHQVPNLSPD